MKALKLCNRRTRFGRLGAIAVVIAGLASLGNGCSGVNEGDRCNPSLSHNECADGLSCVQPATCVESYCCPADPTQSTNAYCNGQGCPTPEAGTGDDAGDDAAGDAPASDSSSSTDSSSDAQIGDAGDAG